MKKYKVRYSTSGSTTKIDADSSTEAYKLFLKQTSVKPVPVVIHGLFSSEFFEDHIEAAKQRIHEKEKVEGEQSVSQATNELEDLEIEYQESGWAGFLNVCGCLNLILFVIGVIWLFNAKSSDQFMAMNLTIIGLVAAINSFFFAFLVNTFTRIQHNTHLTTLELIKLNKKNDLDN